MRWDIISIIALILAIIILLFLNRNKEKAKLRKLNEKFEDELDGPF